MSQILFFIQNVAIFLLFVETLITARQRPSRFQTRMLLLIASTLIMLVGYTVEWLAVSEEIAVIGAGISYIGKPIALMLSALCVAEYCNFRVPLVFVIVGAVLGVSIPTMILLPNCNWYYSSVDFNIDAAFSPLTIHRGPAYYLYAAYLFVTFAFIFVILTREYLHSKNKTSRKQAIYLACSIGASLVGYILYLTGVSRGYDATMLGAAVGVFIMFVLVIRFPFFDTVTYSKQRALENASSALFVFNAEDRLNYQNKMGTDLLKDGVVNEKQIKEMPIGESRLTFGESIYEVVKNSVDKNNYHFGQTVELSDVTAKVTYSVKLEKEVAERTERIRELQRTMITTLADIIEARDTSTGEHVKRVCRDVYEIGVALRENGDYVDLLTDDYLDMLKGVAALHDIGKIGIPDSILCKPGKLTEEEFAVIKTHPVKGASIIETSMVGIETPEYIAMAKDVALFHHEKWNGKGYPMGLKEKEIPLAARIMAVADVYDAVRFKRCYRDAMSRDEARGLIEEERGNFFDPKIVDAFLKVQDTLETITISV